MSQRQLMSARCTRAVTCPHAASPRCFLLSDKFLVVAYEGRELRCMKLAAVLSYLSSLSLAHTQGTSRVSSSRHCPIDVSEAPCRKHRVGSTVSEAPNSPVRGLVQQEVVRGGGCRNCCRSCLRRYALHQASPPTPSSSNIHAPILLP
jgi:hypothetical protein